MAKTHLHPYMRPLVTGYDNKKFLDESKTILNFLKKTSLKKVRGFEDDFWFFINHKKISTKKNGGWMPKLYICLTAKDYWGMVGDLFPLSQAAKFNWKFCKNPKYFSRPDKIIIYCQDGAEVKKVLRLIRPLLVGKKSHKLFFASSTIENKLEKKTSRKSKKDFDGIYVGLDPSFIKKASWRYYRWSIEESLIKPNLKNGKIDANTGAALKMLNVTLEHYGPRTLAPNGKHNPFIKKVWKQIHDN